MVASAGERSVCMLKYVINWSVTHSQVLRVQHSGSIHHKANTISRQQEVEVLKPVTLSGCA